jgi:hypothetical protein
MKLNFHFFGKCQGKGIFIQPFSLNVSFFPLEKNSKCQKFNKSTNKLQLNSFHFREKNNGRKMTGKSNVVEKII